MLLHAPSGAGKTSLIQAGLIPLLGERRREPGRREPGERRFHPTRAAGVKTPPPEGVHVHNRYIRSVALDLLDGNRDPKELGRAGDPAGRPDGGPPGAARGPPYPSDTRGDSTWWELSHDTLISAVLDDNRKWLRDGSNHGSWRLVPGPRTGKGPSPDRARSTRGAA